MALSSLRVKFIAAWALLLLAKAWLAVSLPPFGDEAFYALESRHLAWAYSDLPGLTAWLIRLGTEVGGMQPLAMRVPFLLIGAALPWQVVVISRRWFGEAAGWQAGWIALLMPLAGMMGLLALPDVPMLFATLVCVDAFARMLVRASWGAAAWLAFGLAVGALSHYRFALVVAAGGVGLLLDPRGRALLREPALWVALAFGALAWWPLLAWNLAHSGAGLGFQFVERHPWQLHGLGVWWPLVQAVLLTPMLFFLLLGALGLAWQRRQAVGAVPWRFVLGVATVAVPGYFLMAFFADIQRVSFHWPLPGWLLLACVAPPVLAQWPPRARWCLFATAGLGLAALFSSMVAVSRPEGRAALAAGPAYPDNFAGWSEVSREVADALAGMPAGTRLVADNFMVGAELAFALDRDDVLVLEHPLNVKHGRAVQLAQWGLLSAGRADWGNDPVLLVVEDTARPLKQRLEGYRSLCARAGSLPPAQVLNVDHGRKRFLLFRGVPGATGCVLPSLAWIDSPAPGAGLGASGVRGWALRPGAGLARIDVTLAGRVVASAAPSQSRPDVLAYWALAGEDDRVGFEVAIPADRLAPGEHWLGLVLHGRDGSVETWPAQRVRVEAQGSR
ncbi:MAG TPA: glycosyltransferase family 39 protein [Arenimonas sp.]|uniref:glycosyltransferase family 39 protein n=1 Tax=Arenimonas sp. TaxID=1872635 RepID=UPI002D7F0C04|nr:glycosyltransferase family 39 protein [Arenimonas sp.]HEU0153089.1 glycosyltransferase family 39 protein [Arenimonas sp.]